MQKEQQEEWEKLTIEEHMEIYEKQGVNRKEAMKLVAKDRGVTKGYISTFNTVGNERKYVGMYGSEAYPGIFFIGKI